MTRTPKLRAAPTLKEAHIQRAVVEFMKLDGWRAIRTELTVQRERGRVVGERGMPDYLFLRYLESEEARYNGITQVLWIEFKAPDEKPKPHQVRWHAAERLRGAAVLVVDDIDAFRRWYKGHSYARRVAA